jgi:hypothetical protein
MLITLREYELLYTPSSATVFIENRKEKYVVAISQFNRKIQQWLLEKSRWRNCLKNEKKIKSSTTVACK